MKQQAKPPKYAEKLLLWFLKEDLAEEVLGDLDEKFYTTTQKHNHRKARRNYWYQVFNYLRPFAFKSTKVNNLIISPMKIHFKYTTRIFKKNALITTASLASVVLGVLSSFLIYLWVNAELTTDQFHSNYDNLYIPVVQQSAIDKIDAINPTLYFRADYSGYSEIENSVQVIYLSEDRVKFEHNNTIYKGKGLVADSVFFDVFDFELSIGDTETILYDPSNIILTESFAKKVFGDADPLGKTVQLDGLSTYQVKGILKDIPSNSSFTFDFLAPNHSRDFWRTGGIEFLVGNNSFEIPEFNKKIEGLGRNHPQFKESTLSVVPFKEVYFDLSLDEEIFSNQGDKSDVNTMILVALVILFVSALNFTNMQSTLILSQIKNKSIKHVHGARKIDFFLELLTSRILYTLIGIVLIIGVFLLIKDSYLSFLELSLNKSLLNLVGTIAIGCTLFVAITTIISLIQSSSSPRTQALFSNKSSKEKLMGGSLLTTIQYVLAIVLIIASAVVFKQFRYMQNKDLGFDPVNLVTINFLDEVQFNQDYEQFKKESEAQQKNYEYLKGELDKLPGIISYSQGSVPLDKSIYNMSWKPVGGDFEYTKLNWLVTDNSYSDLLDLSAFQGRYFTDSIDIQRQNKVVINRAAMEYWGIDNIEGVKLASSSWGDTEEPFEIIGVVEDFNYQHLSRKVEPLVMVNFEDFDRPFTLRITEARFKQTIDQLGSLFNEFYPNRTFTYRVLENQIQAQYDYEKKLAQTFMVFTLIALVISSLGLFTFALYDTQKRIKEIGIRKVIGASTTQVVSLLSTNFIKWVLLAFIIALPLSWYAMNEWLANFANRTELSWWLFLGAGLLTIILAMATVVGQSYTAANQNPVKALRHE